MHEVNVEKLLSVDKARLFSCLFGNDILVKDISYNDDIRNQTYVIGNKKFICKLYADKKRWKREVKNYLRMNPGLFLTPQLVDFGMANEDIGWIIVTYVDAENLNEIYESLDKNRKVKLWKTLGELLAIFHLNNEIIEDSLYLISDLKNSCLDKIRYYDKLKEDYVNNRDRILKNDCYKQEKVYCKAFHIIENWLDGLKYSESIRLCLCHNDFSLRNIMYNFNNAQYYLIDFESGFYAEPELDFARVLLDLKTSNFDTYFFEGYYQNTNWMYDAKKTKIYFLLKLIEICSWSFERSRKYYESTFRMLCKEMDVNQ